MIKNNVYSIIHVHVYSYCVFKLQIPTKTAVISGFICDFMCKSYNHTVYIHVACLIL